MEIKLTEKQKKWAKAYAKTLNATQACREAGYNGSRNVLAQQGADNLKNPKIKAYMAEILGKNEEAEEADGIATIQEVMQFYTKAMRGELKDQFGLDMQMSDRIKSAQALAKLLVLAEKANEDNADRECLTIISHYGREPEEEDQAS